MDNNKQYLDYYYETLVKACLFQCDDDLEQNILEVGSKTYNLNFLDYLKLVIHNSYSSYFVYQEMQAHIYDVIEILREYGHILEPTNQDEWYGNLNQIQDLLEMTRTSTKDQFLRLEYMKRNAKTNSDDFDEDAIFPEQKAKMTLHSILADELMIFCLNPNKTDNFNIYTSDYEDQLIEYNFVCSMNKFYSEHPELFMNPHARFNVIKNLKMIAYPNIRQLNSEKRDYYLEVSESSKILLNRLR